MDEVKLRRLTVDDVPSLSIISKKTFYDSFTGTCTSADMDDFLELYYNENTLKNEMEDAAMNYYFAEINGVPVGYLLFKENEINTEESKNKKTVELKRFYILQPYHGKGIAQKMMNYFLESVSEKYELAFLGVWEYNCRAQYFYTKYGFKATTLRHSFPIGNTPQTDIFLIKDLNKF